MMKTWLLILIAIHINDPLDQPAKVIMELPSRQSCEQAKNTLTYSVKFSQFKVQASCHEKDSNSN